MLPRMIAQSRGSSATCFVVRPLIVPAVPAYPSATRASTTNGGHCMSALPFVPTGMNTGVGTAPWGRCKRVARARPQVATTSNTSAGPQTLSFDSPVSGVIDSNRTLSGLPTPTPAPAPPAPLNAAASLWAAPVAAVLMVRRLRVRAQARTVTKGKQRTDLQCCRRDNTSMRARRNWCAMHRSARHQGDDG